MSEIKISQVGSRADRNAFIRFPWRIYDNDPAWVPPLIIERKAFLNRKRHPFYRHGDAALFLARQNQKIVGRIMASDDPNYNAVHHSNVGCFGLFECIDDRKVAAALFDAAEGWLRRKGRHEIMGPIDYSTNYVCGLLIAGFQFPQTRCGLGRIAEPPRVKIHHFGEATALEQTLVIKGIVGGEKRGRMRKAVN